MRKRNMKAYLTCMDCGKEGPIGDLMEDARRAAEQKDWQVGMRGSGRIVGWEEDFCETCKAKHPRTACSGYKIKCPSRSLYTITRDDGAVIHTCGSHLSPLVKEMVPGGKLTLEVTPI